MLQLFSKPIVALVAFAVLVVLHLLFIKKTRLLINVIALYASFGVMMVLPLIEEVRKWLGSNWLLRSAVFVGVFVLLHFLLSHSNIRTVSERVAPSSFVVSLVYRVVIVGLLVTLVLYPLPDAFQAKLGPLADFLFMNKIVLLVWLFLPLVLVFSYRFKTDGGWLE